MSGKGDKPRPVDKKRYNENYEAIDWNKKPNTNGGAKWPSSASPATNISGIMKK